MGDEDEDKALRIWANEIRADKIKAGVITAHKITSGPLRWEDLKEEAGQDATGEDRAGWPHLRVPRGLPDGSWRTDCCGAESMDPVVIWENGCDTVE